MEVEPALGVDPALEVDPVAVVGLEVAGDLVDLCCLALLTSWIRSSRAQEAPSTTVCALLYINMAGDRQQFEPVDPVARCAH